VDDTAEKRARLDGVTKREIQKRFQQRKGSDPNVWTLQGTTLKGTRPIFKRVKPTNVVLLYYSSSVEVFRNINSCICLTTAVSASFLLLGVINRTHFRPSVSLIIQNRININVWNRWTHNRLIVSETEVQMLKFFCHCERNRNYLHTVCHTDFSYCNLSP